MKQVMALNGLIKPWCWMIGVALFCTACEKQLEDTSPQQSSVAPTQASPSSGTNGLIPATARKIFRPRPETRPYIVVALAKSESSASVVRAPGHIDFRQKAVSGVGAVVAGRVSKLYVQAGDQVRAGTSLVTLSSPDAAAARAKLRDAYAQLQSAEEMFKRQTEMLKRGVGLEMDRFKAEIELKEARTEFERATQAVTFLGEGTGETVNIKAPINGRVVHIKATVGAMVEPGETLMDLGNPASLWVVADVFDRDLLLVREGATALVEIASNPKPLSGRVAVIGTALEGELRRAPVFIEMYDQNISLRPGMYARVSISALSSDRITVPVAAVLIKDSKRTVVYVEDTDGNFENREVVVGQSIDGHVPIIQGLSLGERIVVSGALLLDAEAEQLL